MTCDIHILDTAVLAVMQTLCTKLQRVYITTPTPSILLHFYYKSHMSYDSFIGYLDEGVVRQIRIGPAELQLFIHPLLLYSFN